MKRIIGILGIAVFSMAVFMSTNSVENATEINLASLTGISEANAECGGSVDWPGSKRCNSFGRCSAQGSGNACNE